MWHELLVPPTPQRTRTGWHSFPNLRGWTLQHLDFLHEIARYPDGPAVLMGMGAHPRQVANTYTWTDEELTLNG